MSIPVTLDYTRSHIIDRLLGNELQVGDAVYYLSHTSRYAIKKSTITGKKEIPFTHHSLGGFELTLADSTVQKYHDVFDSKEKALEYIVADLKCSLANKRNSLQTLLREIAEDERLLAMFEKKIKIITLIIKFFLGGYYIIHVTNKNERYGKESNTKKEKSNEARTYTFTSY